MGHTALSPFMLSVKQNRLEHKDSERQFRLRLIMVVTLEVVYVGIWETLSQRRIYIFTPVIVYKNINNFPDLIFLFM